MFTNVTSGLLFMLCLTGYCSHPFRTILFYILTDFMSYIQSIFYCKTHKLNRSIKYTIFHGHFVFIDTFFLFRQNIIFLNEKSPNFKQLSKNNMFNKQTSRYIFEISVSTLNTFTKYIYYKMNTNNTT